jgi:tRNA(fMet)-specific endonuclease VapC
LRYLLDANSIIYLLSGTYPNLTQRVAETEAGAIGVSAIAFAEVAHGSSQGKPPELKLLDSFIDEIPLVLFDQGAARSYAGIPFKRNSYDRLIAAQALSHDLTVISVNVKDFADVPGLKVENWTV